jgi:L-ascorbate metabolism protein UlaG (beta-lactamase superfamily)
MKIYFVGQSTFKLTLDGGIALLTDPWFAGVGFWRAVAPACGPEGVGRVDFILASHNHLDHIDKPSLRLAQEQGATVVGSERVAKRAAKAGVKNVVALRPGQEHSFTGFGVKATPAFHPLAKDAIGFLIRRGGRQIYFCGDTRPDARLVAFLQESGPVDLAFLQISCAVYFGKDDGLRLETAVELAKAVKPKMVVPMHYHGRFKVNVDPARLGALLAGSGIETLVIGLGEEKEVWA